MSAGCKSTKQAEKQHKKNFNKTYTEEEIKVDDLFLQGITQKELGNHSEAKEILKTVLELTGGKYPPADYYLAEVYFQNKEFDNAISHAEKAVEQEPENLWFQIGKAQLYQKLSQYDKAARTYEKIVKANPEKEPCYFEWANSLLAQKDYDGALNVMDKYEKRFGISEPVSMQKRNLYLGLGKTEDAIKEVEKLQAAFPFSTRYNAILAETFMTQKNYTKAKQYYDQILRYHPEDPHIHLSLANFHQLTGNMEQSYEELKKGFANPNLDYKTKISLWESIFGNQTPTPSQQQQTDTLLNILLATHQTEAEAFSLAGNVLFSMRHFDPARKILKTAHEKGDRTYRLFEQLIFLETLNNGSEKKLIEYCEEAIEYYPEQPLPYLFKGNALVYESKDYEQGVQILETGLNWVIGNVMMESDFHSALGEAYHHLKNYPQSDRNFRKAILLQPENYLTQNNFAYYLSLRGENLSEARKLIETVLKKYPKEATFLDTYAMILFKQGECNKAKEIMQSIIKNNTASMEQLQHYAEILNQCGEKDRQEIFLKNTPEEKTNK